MSTSGAGRGWRRWRRQEGLGAKPGPWVVAGLLLVAASCDELPVREEIELDVLANGAVVARVRTTIAADDPSNPTFTAEARSAREAAVAGRDPWALRLVELGAGADRSSYRRRAGVLREVVHEAVLDQPEQLTRLFAETPLAVRLVFAEAAGTVEVSGQQGEAPPAPAWEEAELEILPGVPAPASRRDRERFARELRRFSGAAAEHLAAVRDLYGYLETQPARDLAVLAAVFEAVEGASDRLSAQERALVERLAATDEGLLAAMVVPPGEARSLDALSRRLFDPFPGPIRVLLPVPPSAAAEGFRCAQDDCRVLVAQGPSLWSAFAGLVERWVTPDPLLAALAVGKGESVDVLAFRARERWVAEEIPGPDELATALASLLAPAAVYRVRFAVQPAAEPALDEVWGR
jgi:hypothetical protein